MDLFKQLVPRQNRLFQSLEEFGYPSLYGYTSQKENDRTVVVFVIQFQLKFSRFEGDFAGT